MKIYLLVLFSFITVAVSAQSHRFADSTAQWNIFWLNIGIDETPNYDTHIYRVNGDTVINGLAYQYISCESLYQPNFRDEFLRRDSLDCIYLLLDTQELKIYDFGANVGDTVFNVEIYRGFGIRGNCVVDSIDSVNIGGIKRKLYVRYLDGFNTLHTEEWVDGIGSLKYNSITHLVGDLDIIFMLQEVLLCYYEDSTLGYLNEDFTNTCYTTNFVGLDKVDIVEHSLFPNPINNKFAITLSEQPKQGTTLLIHEGLGRIVKREELVSSTQQISVADLPNGMYTYAVMLNSVRQASGKLVIAK